MTLVILMLPRHNQSYGMMQVATKMWTTTTLVALMQLQLYQLNQLRMLVMMTMNLVALMLPRHSLSRCMMQVKTKIWMMTMTMVSGILMQLQRYQLNQLKKMVVMIHLVTLVLPRHSLGCSMIQVKTRMRMIMMISGILMQLQHHQLNQSGKMVAKLMLPHHSLCH